MAVSGQETLMPAASKAPRLANAVATFLGIGRLRPGPGTWGSLATALLWFAACHWIPLAYQVPSAIAATALVVAVGIPAATSVSRAYGAKDPQCVVIDEVAGQLTALVASAVSWKSFLLGFILFRGFDILKPPPVRHLERLPEGVGIVVDDLGAGLYALAVMQLLRHFGLLPH